jgi:carbonic anhydrase
LQPFDDDAQALALANAPRITASPPRSGPRDLDRAHRIAARLNVGMVWINTWLMRDLRTPFGGVGQSGLGREGGHGSHALFHRRQEHRNRAVTDRFAGPAAQQRRTWAERVRREDPELLQAASRQQAPKYLWIGCSDSRVPANQILGLDPGEVFVHRNVANLVVHTDLNCLSSIQFAVDLLKVEHILVVGHYGCSGVHASLTGARVGLADNWLRHVGDVCQKACATLLKMRKNRKLCAMRVLCELNVIEQVAQRVPDHRGPGCLGRGQALTVHGWIYGLHDGKVRQLGLDASSLTDAFRNSIPLRSPPSETAGTNEQRHHPRRVRPQGRRPLSARASRRRSAVPLGHRARATPGSNVIPGNVHVFRRRPSDRHYDIAAQTHARCSPMCAPCSKPAARAGTTWSTSPYTSPTWPATSRPTTRSGPNTFPMPANGTLPYHARHHRPADPHRHRTQMHRRPHA